MGKTGQEGVHNMKKWEEKSKMKVAWRRENQGLLALKSSKMLELREASTFLQEMNEILPWYDDKATLPAQIYEIELNQNSLPDNKVEV